MQEEMNHLGQIFRSKREELNLSLREVENAISIRAGYLEAIEEGNFSKLISPIYAHGFITKYATFLEMDGQQLIEDHPHVNRILNEKIIQTEEYTFGIGTLDVRGSPGGQTKWLPNIIWVALSASGLLGMWFLARHLGLF